MDLNYWNLLANLLTFVVVVGGLIGAFYGSRRKGQADAASEWREEAAAIRTRAYRLHDDLEDALAANREMQQQVTKLEALPDMTALLAEMKAQREAGEQRAVDAMQNVTAMFENHETRAMERHRLMIQSFAQLTEGLAEINKSLRHLNGRTE